MKSPNPIQIPLETGAAVTALVYQAPVRQADATLILAHGAGADQRSAFMVSLASAMAARGVDTITFNFPYTEQRRKVPDRAPVLESCYAAVISAVHGKVARARRGLFVGGKSMGGRVATQVVAGKPELPVTGLVLLGYPLHPPGRPEQRRDAHFSALRTPMLIVQGSRDVFGTPTELEPALALVTPRPALHVIEGGDHSFKMGRGGSAGQAAVYEEIQTKIAEWIRDLRH